MRRTYLGENEDTSCHAEFSRRHKADIRFQLVDIQPLTGTNVDIASVGRRQTTDGHVTGQFRSEHHGAAGEVGDADPAAAVSRGGHGQAGVLVAETDQAESVLVARRQGHVTCWYHVTEKPTRLDVCPVRFDLKQ